MHPYRLPERRLCATAVALLAGTSALAVAAATGSAPAASKPAVQQPRGMQAGRPFADPPVLKPSANGTLRLVTARTRFNLGGRRVWGDSYNGSFVGPTLQFAPQQHVTLKLINRLPVTTNLHFHGMHISPSGAQDNPYIQVTPRHDFTYHIALPADQPQGTFWYHDHGMVMGSMGPMKSMDGMAPTATTGSDVESQIFAGLSGTILVGDDRSLLPADLQHVVAHTLVFKDVQINRHNEIVQNTKSSSIDSNAPTIRLVNGELRPVLSMHPGETQLWRLANEGADIFYRLHLAGWRFTVVGEDGYPVPQITTTGTLLLPPGRRYDVLLSAPAKPGNAWLQTLRYGNGPQGDVYPTVRLLKVHVAGAAEAPLPMPTGAVPTAMKNLADAQVARRRTITLSENSDATTLYINGKQFNMDKSVFKTPGIEGTVEQWTIINKSGEIHPFHVHTNHFQVMSVNGVRQPYTATPDIIPVPYEQHGVPGRVVIRIALSDFTGKWMFHCHIAAHEDNGMMSFLNVIAPPRRTERSA